ncbi:60S acidic ribosomal protein P1 [Flagelloscypha sp. PMI_526]|nr:60S acidic ribosomal protein P1 [Flagelloscypha sp. PMI_526]
MTTEMVKLAATYAALILADDGINITTDKILLLTNGAGIELEPIWASLPAKALEGKDVKELLLNMDIGEGGPTIITGGDATVNLAAKQVPEEVEMKEEEESSESDFGMVFDLNI